MSWAEWLVEEGIGEHRAVLFDGSTILAARLHWPGTLVAGQVEDAQLISRSKGSPRGVARFASGEEALVDRLPASASEAAKLRLAVSRAALWETGRRKRAQARPSEAPLRPAPTLAESLGDEGPRVRVVRRFPGNCDWTGLWREAAEGRTEFPGGALLFYPTPAMLLVDIDGDLSPDRLALAAVPPLGAALARFDCGGNIGIDFPTIATKPARKALDAALDAALEGWPHERTAINGFGFVQLVARLERPSLLARIAHAPAAAHARALLREAEGLDGPGVTHLHCPPAVAGSLRPVWLEELEKRTARPARVMIDEARLDPAACHAQIVPHD